MEVRSGSLKSEWLPLVVLPVAVCLAHLLCIQNYGYFRDELYYLACAKRLAWGYVDHPPFCVFLLKLVVSVYGDGLAAIRAPIVVASGLTVLVVQLTARKVGANATGVWMAGLFTVLSGMYLVIFSFYSMNSLDILLWAIAGLVTVHILEKGGLGEWLLLGAVLGIAFMDKASVLWLVAGLFVAFLATPYRSQLKTIGPWAALVLFLAIISPHLMWQAQNGWPTLEFASNAQREKLLPLNPFLFFVQQAVVVNLVAVPFFIAALFLGLRGDLKKWAPLCIAFLFVVAVLIINGKSRINYLAPGYTLIIPLAGLAAQNWIKDNNKKLKTVLVALALTSPLYWGFGLPWLSPEKMIWLIERSPIQPLREEKGPKSPMQGWADMFGWQELASGVRATIKTLPESEQLGAAVVTKNYGEAAALEHFGVTNVICGHNNYYLWGPGEWNGRVAVFVNRWDPDVTGMFESFEQVGTVVAPNAVPEQNGSPIWVARGLKVPVSEFWRRMKKYL